MKRTSRSAMLIGILAVWFQADFSAAGKLVPPAPVFHAGFEGTVTAADGSGNPIEPIAAERVSYAAGLEGQALMADSVRLVYPAEVLPQDEGTVEIVASPLPSGTGTQWMFLCGDDAKWGPVGVPRLWRWNGQPRFDMDSGSMNISAGTPAWFDWSPGTWHLFTGTWNRKEGRVMFYLDGVLIGSKRVPPWENETCNGFALGSGRHINDTSVDYARALIDSVTIYDRALPALTIAMQARKRGIRPLQQEQVDVHPEWRNSLRPRGQAGPAMTLAADGSTAYRILLPEAPTSQEEKAAADLNLWLGEMTDVSIPMVTEASAADSPVISIGRTQRLATASPAGSGRDLGREGYGIAVDGRDLFLWGGSGRGVVNAVYAFLEEDLGCRWYHRDSFTIPRRPTCTVTPVTRTFVPALEIRDPFYWDAFHATWSLRNRTNSRSARVPEEWGGRMDYAGGYFVHTYNRLVPPATYFEEHPEYYSEIGGKRVAQQLCLSHPDVLTIATDRVRAVLRANPGAQLISVSPNDGRGYCECKDCLAFDRAQGGTRAGTLLRFVNSIADAIREDFPTVQISTLAYLDTVQPPKTVRPRDNVVIRLCTDRHAWSHFFEFVTETDAFSGALQAWHEIGAKLHIWDYTVNFSHYSLPSPNMPVVTQNVRWMINHGVQGIMLQGAYQSPGSARGPLRSWVWAKQLWDPGRGTRELIRDFTYGFYGEAAEPLQAYNELLWSLWEREYMGDLRRAGNIRHPPSSDFLTAEFAADATALFSRAERLAQSEETRRRVALAAFSLLYLKLSRGPGFLPGEDYGALCDEFQRVARNERVSRLWEDWRSSENHVDRKLSYWRGLARARDADFRWLPIGPECMFRPDPDRAGEAEGWYEPDVPDLAWARIQCGQAGGWNQQGFPKLTGDAWYRIRFDVPADFGLDEPVRLFVGAADEDAIFYLNGHRVFEHTCESTGLTPEQIWDKAFLFDPGTALRRGGENLLAVRIHNRLGMGGLWKPLYLVSGKSIPDPDIMAEAIRLRQ